MDASREFGNMKVIAPIPGRVEKIAGEIVDSAFAMHTALGPGLLESVYESCLVYELKKRGVEVKRQVQLPVVYDGLEMDSGFRIDLLAGNCVVVEIKSAEAILPVHKAQLLTYLKLSGHRLGLLVNFNVALIKSGIKRVVC